jgi:hypothetical protein
VIWDGVRGGVDSKVSVGVRVPGGNAVEFRGNATIGVKVLAGVVVVVRDGVWGGVDGKVSVGVRVPGGNAVEFRVNATIGIKVLAGVVV